MCSFPIPKRHVDIFAGHFKRRMPQDFLQAKGIPTVDQITNTEGMLTDVRVQLGNAGLFFHTLEYFGDCGVGDLMTVRADE